MRNALRDKGFMVRLPLGAGLAVALLSCSAMSVAGFVFLSDRRDGSAAGTNVSGTITGNCNANGINNQIRCGPLGPSMAGISVGEDLSQMELWFDGPPEALPVLPADLAAEPLSCRNEKLLRWFRTIDRLYSHDAGKLIILNAGEPDLVTLTAANVDIRARKEVRAEQGTWIMCQFGGGGLTQDHIIEIDTQLLKSTLFDVPEEQVPTNARKMPPAALSLGDKSQASVSLSLLSKRNHAYSGVVSVTTSTNGTASRLDIGDDQAPLRWMELASRPDGVDYYALDGSGGWVKNWQPY